MRAVSLFLRILFKLSSFSKALLCALITSKYVAKPLLNNSAISGLAKNLGVNTSSSSESLDDFVTQKAIDGLFNMISEKEAGIRANPVEQTSSILKQVFGK